MVFIAGDWGTTQARLYLCDGASVLDRASGAGVGTANVPADQIFSALTAGWVGQYPSFSAHLCGMVGSRNGWVETPYVQCPADASALRKGLVTFDASGIPVSIVPGLSCTNPLDAPDVMRGEETQILGALTAMPGPANQRRLFALPGTHTKWVVVEGSTIQQFLTSPTGELFALLRDYSTLGRAGSDEAVASSTDSFMRGIARQAAVGNVSLTHILFEARSRQLIDGISKADAMGFLSGLLIGADIAGALQWFGRAGSVILIGDPALTELYTRALAFHSVDAMSLNGEECVLNGLRAIFELDPKRKASHVPT